MVASPQVPILYDAFISYSWAKDRPLVTRLRKVLQSLGKPWWRRRSMRVFLDDASLSATPELWPSIERAIAQSRYMILFASPEAARSRWVDKEAETWLATKPPGTLLIALSGGDLRWDEAAGDFAWDDATPLPPSLKGAFHTEPKWIDLRPFRDAGDVKRDDRFLGAAADFASTISGTPKEDLLSEEVRQQKRALGLAYSAATALGLLALVAAGLGLLAKQQGDIANQQREEATKQRDIATEQRNVAEQQRGIAVVERNRAEENERKAVDALDSARRNISMFRAEQAEALIRDNQKSEAMLLALESLPDQTAQTEERRQWPVTPQAQVVLEKTLREGRGALTLFAHDRDVYGLRFSADGRRLLSSSWDGIKLWDVEAGKQIATLEGTALQSIAEFSADGRVIITGEASAVVKGEKTPSSGGLLWDGMTGAQKGEIRFPAQLGYTGPFNPDESNAFQFNRTGNAAIYAVGRQIDIWRGDIWKGKLTLVKRNTLRNPGASPFDFAPVRVAIDDAGSVGVTVHGTRAHVWDMESGEKRAELGPFSGPIESVHLDEVNSRVVVADRAGTVQVWDLKSGSLKSRAQIERHAIFDTADAATNVQFSRSGTHLLISVDKGSTQLVDLRTRQSKLIEPTNAAYTAFSDDGRLLVAATVEEAIVTEVETGKTLFRFGNVKSGIKSVAFSPDSGSLATGAESGEINIWSLKPQVQYGETVAARDCRRHIWLDDLSLFEGPDGFAQLNDQGIGAAVLDNLGREVSLLNTDRRPPAGKKSQYIQIAVNAPKGLVAMPGNFYEPILIWDVRTGEKRKIIDKPHTDLISGMHFSGDGRFFLTYSGGSLTAKIWNADDFSLHQTLTHEGGEFEGVEAGCLSPDGTMAVTTSPNTISVWDTEKRQKLRSIPVDFEPAYLDFGDDLQTVIVGYRTFDGRDEHILAKAVGLPIDLPRLVEQAKQNAPSCLTRAQREQLLLAPEPPDWCIEMNKTPYNTDAWRQWLKARRRGESVALPN